MDEVTVVKEALTEEMKNAGARLTRALDEGGWPVMASFWYFESDENQWMLFIASPRVSTRGSGEGYDAVIDALDALRLSRSNVNHTRVVAPDHPVVKALASAFQTGPTITGIPFSRQAIDRAIIDDAYIYRVTSESAAA
jgi:hypothetical protein